VTLPSPTVRPALELTADLRERAPDWKRLAFIPFGRGEARLGHEVPPVHTDRPLMPPSFAVARDGSFWILDVVKRRIAHYAPGGSYLGEVGGLFFDRAHPYPVDLRSARATPAPPAAMVGYSARLATSTTFTGLVFSGCAHVPDWRLSLIVGMPCVMWSATRLARTRRRWEDPVTRARVVSTVAA